MDREIYEKITEWIDGHFEELIGDIRSVASIPSVAVYDDPETPYGQGCRDALAATLKLAEKYGFDTHNEGNRYSWATMRPSEPGNEISFWGHLDVVPAGDGWQLTEPFGPKIVGDWLIGRGTDDNKGPALGILYLLRAFEELKIPTKHGLRLYFGCDEENGMSDVTYYAAREVPRKLTLIPDCGFPVCYGEKGIIEADIVSAAPMKEITEFRAGMASNIVPDKAEMTLRGETEKTLDAEWVRAEREAGATRLFATGLSRHSAFPEGGVNAIHELTKAALASGIPTGDDRRTLAFFTRINDTFDGSALGIEGEDAISGKTTCVGTMASMTEDGRALLHVNIRYVISADDAVMLKNMEKACGENGCGLRSVRVSRPNYFPREAPVVDALTAVFNGITGENREPYVMGGGTYARKLSNAMGFGLGGLKRPEETPFAPGHGGAHQPDEGLYLPNFKKALGIFAMAILEADSVMAEQDATGGSVRQ